MGKLPFSSLIVCVGVSTVLALAEDKQSGRTDERVQPRNASAFKETRPTSATRISLKDATAIVRQAYGGRLLSATAAQRRGAGGQPENGYRFRVDVDGTVKTVFVDTRGRIHAR